MNEIFSTDVQRVCVCTGLKFCPYSGWPWTGTRREVPAVVQGPGTSFFSDGCEREE